MIATIINKRPFKFSKKHSNVGDAQNGINNGIVYQQKISASKWWLHVGVIWGLDLEHICFKNDI